MCIRDSRAAGEGYPVGRRFYPPGEDAGVRQDDPGNVGAILRQIDAALYLSLIHILG